MSQEQSVIDAFLIKGTDILFNNIVLYIYICVAILYTILMKGAQFRYVFHAGRLLFRKHKGGGTSGFASYAISTASRVGAGNMAGIMVAISTGGPGALFWMWIMALFGSAMSFGESTLAQFYKEKNSLGQYVGGGSFYIRSRLKMPLLAATFALIMITANTSVNGIQANTIANSLAAYNLDKNITGIILAIITAVILLSPGRTAIIKACTYIVPVMAIPYLLFGLLILIINIKEVPAMFGLIISEAFNPSAAFGGAIGHTIVTGLRRSLFSNDAGLGGGAHAAAAATTSHPARQGFLQMFSVFTDTLLICSVSGFILLLSPSAMDKIGELHGINLMQYAMTEHFGEFGTLFLTLCVVLFSFSTILGNFFYIQTGMASIKDTKLAYYIVVFLTLMLVLGGSIANLQTIWNLGDFVMGFMALINLIVLVILRKPVVLLLNHYLAQWHQGKYPVYVKGDLPEIETDAVTQWNREDNPELNK